MLLASAFAQISDFQKGCRHTLETVFEVTEGADGYFDAVDKLHEFISE